MTAERTSHWLMITSRGYWLNLHGKNEWAFADKSIRLVEKIHPGDHGIVYLTKQGKTEPSALGGVFVFTGTQTRLTGGSLFDHMFPIRLPIRTVFFLKNPVPFGPLVQKLAFIRSKDSWGRHLQGHAAIEIYDGDFDTLIKDVENSV